MYTVWIRRYAWQICSYRVVSVVAVSNLDVFQLLAMVPQPVKAVILLFPITDSVDARAKQEDERIETEGQRPVDPTIFWIKQTVRLNS